MVYRGDYTDVCQGLFMMAIIYIFGENHMIIKNIITERWVGKEPCFTYMRYID